MIDLDVENYSHKKFMYPEKVTKNLNKFPNFIWNYLTASNCFLRFRHIFVAFSDYRISSYNCRGNYSFLSSSSEETIQIFISLM